MIQQTIRDTAGGSRCAAPFSMKPRCAHSRCVSRGRDFPDLIYASEPALKTKAAPLSQTGRGNHTTLLRVPRHAVHTHALLCTSDSSAVVWGSVRGQRSGGESAREHKEPVSAELHDPCSGKAAEIAHADRTVSPQQSSPPFCKPRRAGAGRDDSAHTLPLSWGDQPRYRCTMGVKDKLDWGQTHPKNKEWVTHMSGPVETHQSSAGRDGQSVRPETSQNTREQRHKEGEQTARSRSTDCCQSVAEVANPVRAGGRARNTERSSAQQACGLLRHRAAATVGLKEPRRNIQAKPHRDKDHH
ncbi:hypothetical protein SKAU_G00272890 [Synaphobranchus kaupii]|uniref:Uncharacterized protein n=1 Tax=Synaphobranchus kaupii TaxID=118154 RepID=A0A9Q1F0N2_SYNKA|nr:hypothetical protein SKAU_G00272890 [Synaphobranchus kaupii]